MGRSRYISVEVDLDEFDDEAIREEFEARELKATPDEAPLADLIEEMFYAFKLGRDDLAVQLARGIAEQHTGRIL